jgi:hypothetical protein
VRSRDRFTGRDHGEPLRRAPAIETQRDVLAPAQYGRHDGPGLRESYRHALIVAWPSSVLRAVRGPADGLLPRADTAARIRLRLPLDDVRRGDERM